MKHANVGLCAIVVVFGVFLVNASPVSKSEQMLGANRCTWGPSYWCSNLTNAKGCNAVTHCIQTVWETRVVPEDNDSICQICKDMVKQARDQLRSNETLEELKEVFEGSCHLIPIKVIDKDCCKLADNFIPELVETLSSQMNPDQVCSVAGLCNNAEIDRLLLTSYAGALDGTLKEEESSSEEQNVAPVRSGKLSCGGCNHIATIMTEKFGKANRDDILENILHLCGEMSSFSDACSSIVLTYFNDIYEHLKQHLEPAAICHISGTCSMKYHQHEGDINSLKEDYATLSAIEGGDDIPCELCEQLVNHLRDLLVANTTEAEFKQVLEGLCKQSGGFKDECLSIVDQYYDVIYNSLVKNLNANGACFMIGVCPKGKKFEGEIRPLLPAFPPAEIKVTIRRKLGANEPKFTEEELAGMALPIDHLMGAANPGLLVENGQLCTLCEYMLHFIQETLATPATEEEIKTAVNGVCNKFPNSIRNQCHNFIDMYGDAVIALLIQGLNPREICPKLQMCPPNHENHDDMEVFNPVGMDSDEQDQPTCPLCLFAVEQAQMKIKDDKSKKNIQNVLDHLCARLPEKLRGECVDFIHTYSNELIDMLITDFKPQEICVALKLCPKSNSYLDDMGISLEDENNSSEEDFTFNEIDYNSRELPTEIVFGQHPVEDTPNCLLCVELVKIAEKKIDKHATKQDIKKALEHSCQKLRKNLQSKCHHVVDKYGDKIADMILREMAPKMLCRELGMCLFNENEDMKIDEAIKYDVIVMPNARVNIMPSGSLTDLNTVVTEPPNCVLCEFIMVKLEAELKNNKTQEEIKHTIRNICNHMPKTVAHSCNQFIDGYANAIIAMINSVPPKEICQMMHVCPAASLVPELRAGLPQVVTNDVIECGVCHGATVALLEYFQQHLDLSNIIAQDMVSAACENLPAKYYQSCSDMVSIYGPSILNLSQKPYVDESHICAEIGQCYNNEKSSLAFARISA